VAIGKKHEALRVLQKVVESGRSMMFTLIKTDPLFDELHSDPQFVAILKTIKLAD
jgi:hypothetical protein